jgi:hypothetical protein
MDKNNFSLDIYGRHDGTQYEFVLVKPSLIVRIGIGN